MDLVGEGVDNERYVLCGNPLDSLLDHMVSILILDALEHLVLEFLDQCSLLVHKNMLKSLETVSVSVIE